MSAPITHIALAEKVFDKYFKDKNKKEFFIGTSFPDIRYLGAIEREKTHLDISNLGEIQEEPSSFWAGLKFHNLVDKVRGCFLTEKKDSALKALSRIDILDSPADEKTLILLNGLSKFAEDKINYSKVKDWPFYISVFDEIVPEEKEFGIPLEKIREWHGILQEYFKKGPCEESWKKISLAFSIEGRQINKSVLLIRKMLESQELKSLFETFYSDFDNLLLKEFQTDY